MSTNDDESSRDSSSDDGQSNDEDRQQSYSQGCGDEDEVDVRKELDGLKKEVGDSSWSDGQKATVKSSDELY